MRSWPARRAALLALCTASLLLAGARGSDDEVLVTCGSLIKLQHVPTSFLLHSHEVGYPQGGGGSGQQSVTGYPDGDDFGSYWIVHGVQGTECMQGTPLAAGSEVRLQHRATGRWLHSHLFKSPITRNQEVSAFGDADTSDTGDVWLLELEKGSRWRRDGKARLKHKDTGMYLATQASAKYGRPIAGHQEVCAVKGKGADTWWAAGEGVYYPPRADASEL